MKKLTIIIVNWNTNDLLFDCLGSLYSDLSIDQDSLEVIVIDNNSSDKSVEMVRNNFNLVKLIVNKKNVGFATANNQGLCIASGKIIILLNSDTIMHSETLYKIKEFMENLDPLSAVGPMLLNKDGSIQNSTHEFPSLINQTIRAFNFHKLFPNSKFFGKEFMTYWDHKDIKIVDYVAGACLCATKATFNKVGMLDERFFMYAEEMDWCLRLKKIGGKVYYFPLAKITHLGSGSSKLISESMFVEYFKSLFFFYLKHFPIYKNCLLVFIQIINLSLRSFGYSFLFIIKKILFINDNSSSPRPYLSALIFCIKYFFSKKF
jgi:hypothetical protein